MDTHKARIGALLLVPFLFTSCGSAASDGAAGGEGVYEEEYGEAGASDEKNGDEGDGPERDGPVSEPEENDDDGLTETARLWRERRLQVWEDYQQSLAEDPTAKAQLEGGAISFGEATMRFTCEVLGEMPDQGYPLYIAMHGGGEGDTPEVNDEQWEEMQIYYRDELDTGIYVAVRGVRDTWDTHFNPESYPIYDELIRYMIAFRNADPNRVYLEGFSAGGDGVYAIAPRMADRFAAANMSSGHPNGVNFLNLRNVPIQLQVGEFDDLYDRNIEAVRYDDILNSLRDTYGGYEHRTLVHYDCGHNYEDFSSDPIPVMVNPQAWRDNKDRTHEDVDCFPPDYMDSFTRDPLPPDLCWDLTTRAPMRSVESFYYLKAPYETTEGQIVASLAPDENRISLDTYGLNGPFSILLNEDMVDFDRPVIFEVDGKTVERMVEPSLEVLRATTWERGDPEYQFEAEIPYADLANADLAAPDRSVPDAAPSAQAVTTVGAPIAVAEDVAYDSRDEVALYLHLYDHLPPNYITKKEAKALGWSGGGLEQIAPGKCIGGDRFGNYEGLLPEEDSYRECDIDTLQADSRGAKRLVFSDDGDIYYTEDHYASFVQAGFGGDAVQWTESGS